MTWVNVRGSRNLMKVKVRFETIFFKTGMCRYHIVNYLDDFWSFYYFFKMREYTQIENIFPDSKLGSFYFVDIVNLEKETCLLKYTSSISTNEKLKRNPSINFFMITFHRYALWLLPCFLSIYLVDVQGYD